MKFAKKKKIVEMKQEEQKKIFFFTYIYVDIYMQKKRRNISSPIVNVRVSSVREFNMFIENETNTTQRKNKEKMK